MNFRSMLIPPGPRSYADLVYLYYLLLLPLVLAVTAVSVVLGNIELPIHNFWELGGYVLFPLLVLSALFLGAKYWFKTVHVKNQDAEETTKIVSATFGLTFIGIFCWGPRVFVLYEPEQVDVIFMMNVIVLGALALVSLLFLRPFRQQYHFKYDSEDTWRIMMMSGMNIALFHILTFIAFQRADIEERNTIVFQQFAFFALCLTAQIELMQLKNEKFERNQNEVCGHRSYQRLMTLSEKIMAMQFEKRDLQEIGLQEAKKQSQETLDQLLSNILDSSDLIGNKHLL
ncbi:unnamed protein product [Caenorhabditis brenneri]